MKDLIFVDFNNADSQGRLRLNLKGTKEDLKKKSIRLRHGLSLLFGDGCELSVSGIVEFSSEEKIWVARIEWGEIIRITTDD